MNKQIVAFTGAGISAASGIPTYQERPWLRTLFTNIYLESQPQRFFAEYFELMQLLDRARPNPAHNALAQYQIPVVTQNIDRLHQKAGSRTVVELHGAYNRFFCTSCRAVYSNYIMQKPTQPQCPKCRQTALRPDVVLYGEDIKDWRKACQLTEQADILLVIGTSLEVYPAALLPELARRSGSRVITINENAEVQLPQLLDKLCQSST